MALNYKSSSQKVRVISEKWYDENMYCPACPSENLEQKPPNEKVIDFICPKCDERFQMKSMGHEFRFRVMNSAYEPKIKSIKMGTSPNYVFMQYNKKDMRVHNLIIVPKHFITPRIIEKRKPLGPKARRAGWVGSNILLGYLPKDARIDIIRNGFIIPKNDVRYFWQQFSFLKEMTLQSRGWITDILICVRKLGKKEFTLVDMYDYEDLLTDLHPKNKNIRPKIRQQMQILRDKGFIEFMGKGKYKIIN